MNILTLCTIIACSTFDYFIKYAVMFSQKPDENEHMWKYILDNKFL